MLYSKLSEIYEQISSTTKRLEKTEILSNFLKQIPEYESEIIYLLLGEIYPSYDSRKIGISNQLVIKAISKTIGISEKKIVQEWKKQGDLGEVSGKLIQKKKQTTLLENSQLTLKKVLDNLRKLPELEGIGTVNKKLSLIVELLTVASSKEAIYLTRTLIGDLRIGIQESTIRDALVKAFFEDTDKKSTSEIIQKAIDKINDLKIIFEISKKRDLKKFEEISLEVGKPVKVMLGPKAESIDQAFESLGTPLAVEYKYDGFRLMIHKNKNQIELFTRSLENVTKQFPEVAEYVKKYVKGDSFILDSEAVGFDSKTKKYQPFQAISQRIKRKYGIEKLQKELPVEINVFDILSYNGKSFLEKPFKERTELVRKIITNQPYKIISSKMIITSDKKEVEKFYEKALKDNQEGIFFKKLDAEYKPGKRVGNWLKLKPNTHDFDLVITSAEYGTGKRSGWLSSFILSCKDENTNKLLEIGKVGTGIKEKSSENVEGISFEELTNLLKPLILKESGRTIEVKPKIILSITYQEIQKSPTYSSGFALRFPRVINLRPDKPLSEITTLEEIEREFEKQNRNK
ncbi:MAG: ATP-dependent DNA ligase [Candidatus Pacearchaeota archaeon]|jgi:DNA ligase-1